jgi:hypothetical protein
VNNTRWTKVFIKHKGFQSIITDFTQSISNYLNAELATNGTQLSVFLKGPTSNLIPVVDLDKYGKRAQKVLDPLQFQKMPKKTSNYEAYLTGQSNEFVAKTQQTPLKEKADTETSKQKLSLKSSRSHSADSGSKIKTSTDMLEKAESENEEAP